MAPSFLLSFACFMLHCHVHSVEIVHDFELYVNFVINNAAMTQKRSITLLVVKMFVVIRNLMICLFEIARLDNFNLSYSFNLKMAAWKRIYTKIPAAVFS
jgi:hypothetical protein